MTRGKRHISRLVALLALGLALAVVALAVLPHSWHDGQQNRPCAFCQAASVSVAAASAADILPPGESARYVAAETSLEFSESAGAASPARAPPA